MVDKIRESQSAFEVASIYACSNGCQPIDFGTPDIVYLAPDPNKATPFDSTPYLEAPEIAAYDNLNKPIVPKFRLEQSTLSQKELLEGISKMSDKTTEQIFAIVMAAQMELEKEGSIISQDMATTFRNLKKLQDKALNDVKAALEKDEKVLGYFKTAQNVLIAASLVTTIVALVVSAEIFSFGAATPFVAGFASVAPYVIAGVMGLTTAGQCYTEVRTKEDSAKFTEVDHNRESYADYASHHYDQVANHAQVDGACKEQMAAMLKRLKNMRKMLFAR